MLKLTFYRNSNDVWIGDLSDGETRLLATTHPATIAAAIFAMDEYGLQVVTEHGTFEMEFPASTGELDALGQLMLDQDMGKWMSGFCTFSRFDFVNPQAMDTQADIHLRTAIHHLPSEFVKVRPNKAEPKGFKKELKKRNQFIYYPWC